MRSPEQNLNPEFKIQTIKGPEGSEVSFSPERGGIITSLKLGARELLYLDEGTFKNKDVSVKGGIPILFPNAGPIPDELKDSALSSLKQHGFARDLKWQPKIYSNGFSETLSANSETKKVFPHDFSLTLGGRFETDGSFSVEQNVENLNEHEDLPISSGLHPYFKVPSLEKSNIEFNFPGGEYVKERIEDWANGKAVSIENPNIPLEIKVPGLGTLVLKQSKEYQRIWIWSLKDKDFICVEPVMRDKGGIIKNPEKISPHERRNYIFNIKLNESKS